VDPGHKGKARSAKGTLMPNYYKRTQQTGRPTLAYYYDRQLRSYILQFMAIFTGLQVSVGKRQTGTTDVENCDGTTTTEPVVEDNRLITVPIHYGHKDRVMAALKAENTQNKLLRLPIMSAYMKDLDFLKEYQAGIGMQRRTTYAPTGGLIPDDVKVVHQRRAFPFALGLDLELYASNTDQHFQMLEQILMIFDPMLQIQTSDSLFDMGKITHVELTNIAMNTNFPSNQDRRIIQSTLTFKMPIYLQSPADVRRDFIEKIFMRIGVVNTATQNSFDIIAELDAQGITTPVQGVNTAANTWTVLGNFTTNLEAGNTIQISQNTGLVDTTPFTVVSVALVGLNTEIVVQETIPAFATPNGLCRMPNNYQLIMDVGDLTVQ